VATVKDTMSGLRARSAQTLLALPAAPLLRRLHLLSLLLTLSAHPFLCSQSHICVLHYQNLNCSLLPLHVCVHPYAEASKPSRPSPNAQKASSFLQQNFLDPLTSVWNELRLLPNKDTRKSILTALETLLRLPEDAGFVHLTLRSVDSDCTAPDLIYDMEVNDLVKECVALVHNQTVPHPVDYTEEHESVGTKVAAYFTVTSMDNSTVQRQLFFGEVIAYASQGVNNYRVIWEDGDTEQWDEAQLSRGKALYEASSGWTVQHESVGKKVAAYFLVPNGEHVFRGAVTKYLPPSNSRLHDQLYHIVWEDGDEEDYGEEQFQRGLGTYISQFETVWTAHHPSVGTKVAAYFLVPLSNTSKKNKNNNNNNSEMVPPQSLFVGEVKKFTPETSAGAGDHLYHIVWEDGDEEDYDEELLQKGKLLYKLAMTNVDQNNKKGKKRQRTS
jgi:hypothetical protein